MNNPGAKKISNEVPIISSKMTVLYKYSQFCSCSFKLWLYGIPFHLHLIIILEPLQCDKLCNRLLSGSNARHFSTPLSQRSPEDKRSTQSFDERIINLT